MRVLEPLLSGWAPLREAWQGGRQTAHASGHSRGLEARDNGKSSSRWATGKGARSAGVRPKLATSVSATLLRGRRSTLYIYIAEVRSLVCSAPRCFAVPRQLQAVLFCTPRLMSCLQRAPTVP
eukprot:scaffold3620_cov60-Phaeocystis_antarctica.AAC.2